MRTFGRRAFRRPLTQEELHRYDALFLLGLEIQPEIEPAASMVLQAMLESPQFLYVPEFGVSHVANDAAVPLTAHELATRLSLFLWDDLPDDTLSAAADANALSTAADIEAQARRMLADPRARQTVRSFHRQWLDLGRLDNTSKDPITFPSWNETLQSSMKEESPGFVERAIFDDEGTLNTLLTSTTTQVNAALADIYGVTPPASGWASITLNPQERAGILTLPGILAAHGHPVAPSPVLRGVFVMDRFLCTPPPAPPPGVATNIADKPDEAPRINRERYAAHVTDAVCASCHVLIDGAGFPFEHYDTTGRYRTTDNGFPVDASGELYNVDVAGPVENAIELAQRLAKSDDVRQCMTTQWFRYAFGRVEEAADACTIATLDKAFARNQNNILDLLVTMVTSRSFSHRPGRLGT